MSQMRRLLVPSVVLFTGLGTLAATGPAAQAETASPQVVAATRAQAGTEKAYTFVVNTRRTNASTRAVVRGIRAKGASVSARWPKLGVVVGVARNGQSLNQTKKLVSQVRSWRAVQSAGVSGRIVVEAKPVARMGGKMTPTRKGIGAIAKGAQSVAANRLAKGRGVTIGIADQGVFAEHTSIRGRYRPAISGACLNGGRLVQGRNSGRPGTKSYTHGTSVASVAAGRTGAAIRGVAPRARIASIRVVSANGNIYPEAAMCSAMWAVRNKVPVLNASYGIDWADDLAMGALFNPTNRDQAAVMTAVGRAFAYARSRGVLTIAAVGNHGVDLSQKPSIKPSGAEKNVRYTRSMKLLPAELPSVIGVGGQEAGGEVDFFSNTGLGVVDISAVGTGLLAKTPNKFEEDSGTSFATPAVAGAAALIKQLRPRAKPAQVKRFLMRSATPRTCKSNAGEIASDQRCRQRGAFTSFFGAGNLNAQRAATLAKRGS